MKMKDEPESDEENKDTWFKILPEVDSIYYGAYGDIVWELRAFNGHEKYFK